MSSDSYVRYCPACGHSITRAFVHGRERPVCERCGHIHFEEPKVAAGVLVMRDSQVLLVRRIMEPNRGLWSIPAGFVDAGEDPAEAAVREVREETGLIVEIDGLLDVVHDRAHPNGASIIIIYAGRVISGEMGAGDDVDGVDYFDLAHLPPLAFETTQKVIEHLQSK